MKKIVLMADGPVGVEVAKTLVTSGEKIVRLYLHDEDKAKSTDELIIAADCEAVCNRKKLECKEEIKLLKSLDADFIITVYWAHLLDIEVISCVKDTINFHPALLPINRGWFPHVHSIIDGSPLGVTLHRIDEGADTGPVWAQKEVKLSPYDTAKSIYERLQGEMISMFQDSWNDIKLGLIEPKKQNQSIASYHKKSEINELDRLDSSALMRVGDVINILRARSFGDLGFAYYEENGSRVFINISLSDSITIRNF